jgi:translation initiation factor 2 beta subunit (eIF-2beta)/eIF-5
MKYQVLINKRVQYIKVYKVIKRPGQSENAITKLFMRIFAGKSSGNQ